VPMIPIIIPISGGGMGGGGDGMSFLKCFAIAFIVGIIVLQYSFWIADLSGNIFGSKKKAMLALIPGAIIFEFIYFVVSSFLNIGKKS